MTASSASPVLARFRWFFLVAAVYDMALGLVFFVAYKPMFEWLGMTLPPHVVLHPPAGDLRLRAGRSAT